MPREPPVTIAVFPSSENEGPCAHTPASLPRAYDARVAAPDDVRELALALPGASERPSYGTPGFRVRDRLFARLHQDGESLVLRMERDERELLARDEPRKFFWTPHYERHDWVLVRLAAIDRAELGELLRDAWALRAPPTLRARAPR